MLTKVCMELVFKAVDKGVEISEFWSTCDNVPRFSEVKM